MTIKSAVHPFERAGLGVAPFRCVGHETRIYKAAPDAPAQPGGTCMYCGTGIMQLFHIQASDGRKFHVGSDCVRRTYTEFDAAIPPSFRAEIAKVEAMQRERRRVAKFEATQARAARALATLGANPALFTDTPHPFEYHAGQGKTRRDYLVFCLTKGGVAGMTDASKAIERAVAP